MSAKPSSANEPGIFEPFRVTLRLGDDRFELRAGHYVCFPAGQKAGHALVNCEPGS